MGVGCKPGQRESMRNGVGGRLDCREGEAILPTPSCNGEGGGFSLADLREYTQYRAWWQISVSAEGEKGIRSKERGLVARWLCWRSTIRSGTNLTTGGTTG